MILIPVLIPVQNNVITSNNEHIFDKTNEQSSLSIQGISAYIERGPIEIFNDSAFDLYSLSIVARETFITTETSKRNLAQLLKLTHVVASKLAT